jgi:uncharacterized membrane protein YfcA
VQVMRWTGIVACLAVAGLEFIYGVNYLSKGGTGPHLEVVANWALAALFVSFALVLWRRGGVRWIGITVCAWLAVVGLAVGIVYLTGRFTEGVPWSWAAAVLFAALAAALWRRGRPSRTASPENG